MPLPSNIFLKNSIPKKQSGNALALKMILKMHFLLWPVALTESSIVMVLLTCLINSSTSSLLWLAQLHHYILVLLFKLVLVSILKTDSSALKWLAYWYALQKIVTISKIILTQPYRAWCSDLGKATTVFGDKAESFVCLVNLFI